MVAAIVIAIAVMYIAIANGCVFGNTAIIAKSDHAGVTVIINTSIELT